MYKRAALKTDSPSFAKLNELYKWIEGWTIYNSKGANVTKKFKCVNGWLQAINAH